MTYTFAFFLFPGITIIIVLAKDITFKIDDGYNWTKKLCD